MGKSELVTKGKIKAGGAFAEPSFLETVHTVPDDSLFRDDLFEETREMVQNKNEARVVRDISPFIVPSAEVCDIQCRSTALYFRTSGTGSTTMDDSNKLCLG